MFNANTAAKMAAKEAKRRAKAETKALTRASKAAYKKEVAEARSIRRANDLKIKKSKVRANTARIAATEITGAYVKNEEERTKRHGITAEVLKSWGDLLDGNPSPEKGQSGKTQPGSTTEMDNTKRFTSEFFG